MGAGVGSFSENPDFKLLQANKIFDVENTKVHHSSLRLAVPTETW